EDRAGSELRKHLTRTRLDLRREVDEVVVGESLPRERRWLRWERLRRRRALAGHVARRHRSLLDRPNRRAARSIEDEDEARLRGHGDDVALRAGDTDGAEHGRRGKIVVPEPGVHCLKVPDLLSRARVE